jgi:hypothetical protein
MCLDGIAIIIIIINFYRYMLKTAHKQGHEKNEEVYVN